MDNFKKLFYELSNPTKIDRISKLFFFPFLAISNIIFIIQKPFVIYLLFVVYPNTKTSFKRFCCKIYYNHKMVINCCFYNYKSRFYVITKNCCSQNKIRFSLWEHLFSIPFLKRLFLHFFSRNINHIMIAHFVLLMYCLNIFIY